MPRFGAAFLVCCLIGCADLGFDDPEDLNSALEEEPAPPVQPISFWKDIAPMFVGKCTLCHHPGNATGVDLTRPFDPEFGIIERPSSWSRAKRKLIVDPGRPENSFLLDKVAGLPLDPETEGSPMPLVLPALDASEIARVREWISNGARDDRFFRSEVVPILGDGKSIGTIGRCSLCHYGESSIPDLTDPFGNRGVVSRANSRGEVLVEPGDPELSLLVHKIEARVTAGLSMPLWLEPFSPHEVHLIERWISEGARER